MRSTGLTSAHLLSSSCTHGRWPAHRIHMAHQHQPGTRHTSCATAAAAAWTHPPTLGSGEVQCRALVVIGNVRVHAKGQILHGGDQANRGTGTQQQATDNTRESGSRQSRSSERRWTATATATEPRHHRRRPGHRPSCSVPPPTCRSSSTLPSAAAWHMSPAASSSSSTGTETPSTHTTSVTAPAPRPSSYHPPPTGAVLLEEGHDLGLLVCERVAQGTASEPVPQVGARTPADQPPDQLQITAARGQHQRRPAEDHGRWRQSTDPTDEVPTWPLAPTCCWRRWRRC